MENSGSLWDVNEDKQLINLYSKYKMDIIEIAKIHRRSVVAIEKRLIKHGLIIEPSNKSNFIWEKALEREKIEREKINPMIKTRFEFFCQIISESINEKFQELSDKIDKLELSKLD